MSYPLSIEDKLQVGEIIASFGYSEENNDSNRPKSLYYTFLPQIWCFFQVHCFSKKCVPILQRIKKEIYHSEENVVGEVEMHVGPSMEALPPNLYSSNLGMDLESPAYSAFFDETQTQRTVECVVDSDLLLTTDDNYLYRFDTNTVYKEFHLV